MFIYGFSEKLAYIFTRIQEPINKRWIVWHYTNKTIPSLNFWQRTHESIIVLWKKDKIYNRDLVREPYTKTFLKNSAGKQRTKTLGRFSKGEKESIYQAHENGALPRDVIKEDYSNDIIEIPTLAGGSGKGERIKEHPTQKPIELCLRLLKSCMDTQSDDFVLIPFAGVGSELVACNHLNLNAIGIEINPSYVELIQKRLLNN